MIWNRPRQSGRVAVRIPVAVSVIAAPIEDANENTICESVRFPVEMAGQNLTGFLTDLSLNGAFLAVNEDVPPLLARLALEFELPNCGRVSAVGLVMWRRKRPHGTSECVTPVEVGQSPGVGILFEALHLQARTAVAEMIRQRGDSYRVLVVENSAAMRKMIAYGLRKLTLTETIHVVEAEDGIKALHAIEEQFFDIVIIDLNLPALDGLKLVERARQLPRYEDTPIVMTSTVWTEDDRRQAEALGVSTFLSKPFQRQQITEEVRRLLAQTGTSSSASLED